MDSPRKDYKYDSNFDFEGKNWIYQGLGFGILMFIIVVILLPILHEDTLYSNSKYSIVKLFLFYIIGGLIYGITMKHVLRFLSR